MINYSKLKEDGYLTIKHLGRFELKPSRKGEINGTFGSKKKYENRVKFTPSDYLKEKVLTKNKQI